ncbi:MAG: hypothetical protein Q8882_06025 [Bacillota bacterium]|nr:hypothetical protein [Bacillota bacterium]
MKKFEFSKIIVGLVMLSYFVTLAFGLIVIWRLIADTSTYVSTALCGLFSFAGTAATAVIAFYCNKAKAENVEKIKNFQGSQNLQGTGETEEIQNLQEEKNYV